MANEKPALTAEQRDHLLKTLQTRFEKNMGRHIDQNWSDVLARLSAQADKLWSLSEMERTGGEPDVIGLDPFTGEFTFADCSAESPAGRRSLCYDQEALLSRKENRPVSSAMAMAAEMGVELLDEAAYRALQDLGKFDLKTSSWILTPPEMRQLGGALFCDRRYERIFTYHNGAESYYGARGFRTQLHV
ncbi:MAG TPA: DUF4256 domain-containing protein [Clostridiales bacterium]|nr:DUF4256 domain-containing protein [Clostridiales bacterium]